MARAKMGASYGWNGNYVESAKASFSLDLARPRGEKSTSGRAQSFVLFSYLLLQLRQKYKHTS